MNFTHLHAHTTFSFLDGYGTPEQLALRLQQLGHKHAAITDHGNIIGHVPCAQAYEKAGIKPIFGCEFYLCDDIKIKDKDGFHSPSTGTKGLPHITVMASTQKGYSNLLKLSRASYEFGFYYKPRIDLDMLIRHQEGLVVLSGCPTGYPTRILQAKGYEAMCQFLWHMKSNIERYYIEIVPQPNWNVSELAAPALFQAAHSMMIPAIITADAHFPNASDYLSQDALLAVGLRTTIDDITRELKLPEYQFYCSAENIRARAMAVCPQVPIDFIDRAIENSFAIGEMCNVELQKAERVQFPGITAPMTADDLLWDWCREGWMRRDVMSLIPHTQAAEYMKRLQHEFKVLRSKGFCDYILAIVDVIKWMKAQDGLVMTRGSAGGSLMLWLLGASETDPIRHGLIFERFYDDTRPDPPDVDIDFEQAKREEAIEYIYELYGRDNCSQIAALSRLGPKGAVQDACSAIGIHRRDFACLSEAINDKDFNMERQLASIRDPKALDLLGRNSRLGPLVKGMVGQYRHSSVHAAGVLVSSKPLQDVIGVLVNDGKPIAAVDKHGAAYLGFLKIDMLSVQALDVIGLAARLAKGSTSWLYELGLTDPNVFRTALSGRMAGIFQLDGAAASKALTAIGADSFVDLVAASVLCRPGATESIPLYANNKRNPAAFQGYLSQLHPIAADIVKDTYGVLMYQEQVMRIAKELAGFDWPKVHRLRKDVGDKVGLDPQKGDAWRNQWSVDFINGCIWNCVSKQEAEFWWEQVQHHGGYSFNKSHAVTYGVVGYWMLYLKTYHPAQFYEAYLKLEDDDVVKKKLIAEFKRSGGRVDVISHEFSKATFSSFGLNGLVGGYSDLKYCGPAAAKKMVDNLPYASLDAMLTQLPKRTREMLVEAGIQTGSWDPQALINVAPWMPIPCIDDRDRLLMTQYQLRSVSQMPEYRIDGDAVMCGYVTMAKFDKDRIQFIVEDDQGIAAVRIASNRVKDLGPKFKELSIGDFAAIQGWWTGDVMFAKGFAMLRKKV